MGEIRIFHKDRFLCQAICPELAGATVPLREILRARNRRRRELRGVLRDRQSTVDALLEMKRREIMEKENEPSARTEAAPTTKQRPALGTRDSR